MELKAYMAIIWRRKWIILIVTVVTVAVTTVGTFMLSPTYEATATLFIATTADGNYNSGQTNYADRLKKTYATIATSDPFVKEIEQKLDLEQKPVIDVSDIANTELMEVTVEYGHPFIAAEIANTVAELIVDESNSSPQMRANPVQITLPAYEPENPVKPNKKLNIALGMVVGLVGGLGLALLIESVDTTLYTSNQIETVTELSVLGKVPQIGMQPQLLLARDQTYALGQEETIPRNGSNIFTQKYDEYLQTVLAALGKTPQIRVHPQYLFASDSDYSFDQGEAYRRLRTNIFAQNGEQYLQTLLVTSALPGEGKSTVVANLSYVMAQSGHSVIVIDCDLRRPTIHKIFSLPNDIGLNNILQYEASLEEAIQRVEGSQLHVLTSGSLPSNPSELLASSQMSSLLREMGTLYDVVLIDTPALSAVSDAAALAPAVDGVLLVVGQAQVRQEVVKATQQQLATVNAHSIGVIVNRTEKNRGYGYYAERPQVKVS